MNSSELLRRRQEAANQYKSYWVPRDASEVTMRNKYVANNAVVRSSYHNAPPASGSTTVNNARAECDTALGPGKGFSTDYSLDVVTNTTVGKAVCCDTNWSRSGGMTLQTCAAISTILYEDKNPTRGLTWTSASNQSLTGACPPNNSAQTPHFASDPNCLPREHIIPINANNVYYGQLTTKNNALA